MVRGAAVRNLDGMLCCICVIFMKLFCIRDDAVRRDSWGALRWRLRVATQLWSPLIPRRAFSWVNGSFIGFRVTPSPC